MQGEFLLLFLSGLNTQNRSINQTGGYQLEDFLDKSNRPCAIFMMIGVEEWEAMLQRGIATFNNKYNIISSYLYQFSIEAPHNAVVKH